MGIGLGRRQLAKPQRPAFLLLALLSILLAACWPQIDTDSFQSVAGSEPHRAELRVVADGSERLITTTSRTVGEALAAAGVVIGPADEVSPPAWSPVSGPPPVTEVTIVRVTESEETSLAAIPFQREIVRSADLSSTDEPVIVQRGKDGLQEVVYRIIYQDGLERDRWITELRTVEPAVNEIVMVGVGAERSERLIRGTLAYISDGRPTIVRESTERAYAVESAGALDGRVFQLSPDGAWLLFSRADSDAAFDNSLWLLSTLDRGASPISLNIDNVLWAAWDPASHNTLRIAYTTARSLPNPPGWEANNDIWLLALDTLPDVGTAPIRLANALPATYGWWGGAYSWSPDGQSIAYAFADVVGLLPVPAEELEEGSALTGLLADATVDPVPLHAFEPFDTGAEWAWIPSLAWSPDGDRLVFTEHHRDESGNGSTFDVVSFSLEERSVTMIAAQAGIWSHAVWSSLNPNGGSALYFLKSVEPGSGLGSDYALWSEDEGQGFAQLFPEPGQPGSFPATAQFLAWEPGGGRAAFIFDEALHIMDLATGAVYREPRDDSLDSHPSWAPYGPGTTGP